MKAEMSENSVKLFPENKWEEEVLKKLRQRKVDEIHFQDDWDSKGYLELFHPVHPWDR